MPLSRLTHLLAVREDALPGAARLLSAWSARTDGADLDLPGWLVSYREDPHVPTHGAAESPGLTLEPSDGSVRVAPDALAAGPAFVVRDAERVLAVGSDPAWLAGLVGGALDPVALYQDLEFGYRLRRRTPFRRVERLLPGEAVDLPASGDGTVRPPAEPSPSKEADALARVRDVLAPRVAASFSGGNCLELTAGVDSRLVLALGRAGGAVPEIGMTLGDRSEPDVQVAQAICERLGMRHVVVPPACDVATAARDARAFVSGSGYASNAAAYGWLPGAFRVLEDVRDGQVTGTGGECAGGFYYTPLDKLAARVDLRRTWMRLRLRMAGTDTDALFSRSARRETARRAQADVLERLDRPVAWRRRMDDLYREDRVRQWAGPVLTASRAWYAVSAPLLTPEYIDWALALPFGTKEGRRAQRALTASLDAELGGLPYGALPGAAPARPSVAARGVRLVSKMARRVRGRRAPPDMGSATCAQCLVADGRTRDELGELAADPAVGLDPAAVEDVVARAAELPHELGFLVTAAMARAAAAEALAAASD